MRNHRLFWAFVLIAVGILLMLDQFGWFHFRWNLFWPFILIALGAWTLWQATRGRSAIETEAASIALGGAERATLRMHHGAGRLNVNAGASADALLSGTFGGGLERQARREGDTLYVDLRTPSGNIMVFPWMWGPHHALDWNLDLNPEIPFALRIETGASDTHLDLTDLRITELELKTGVSATHVTLPANAGYTRVRIEAGVASVNVRVPNGVAARVRVDGGLAGISVDGHRFPRVGGENQSPDYDTATNKVEIVAQTGVGSVDVR
jgi:hypothetical protein